MPEAKKYRKLPVVIEATQWFKNGDHPLDKVGEELADPFGHGGTYKRREGEIVRYYRNPNVAGLSGCGHENCDATMNDHGWIDTLEGGHIVCPGDFVITGVKGEHYPCKPDIFALTYELEHAATGTALIAAERERQLIKHGFDAERDDAYGNSELAWAAMHYASPVARSHNDLWPSSWDIRWDQKRHDDRITQLAKAGALIAAEIDRVNRFLALNSIAR